MRWSCEGLTLGGVKEGIKKNGGVSFICGVGWVGKMGLGAVGSGCVVGFGLGRFR